MFFELMIAILLGLASPSHTNNSTCQGTTVSASGDETPPGENLPGDNPGPGTGGDVGQNPPPR